MKPLARLIVEDDKELAAGPAKSLAQSGYQCEVVHTGRAAIAACRATSFDLVVRRRLSRKAFRAHGARGEDPGASAAWRTGRRAHPVWRSRVRSPVCEARVNDQVVPLTARETQVLQALLRRPGRIVGKTQLLDSVYEESEDATSSRLEVQLSRLRRKLAEKGARVRVRVLRGLGYRLEMEDE